MLNGVKHPEEEAQNTGFFANAQNDRLCEKVPAKRAQGSCYNDIAIEKNDESICAKIEDSYKAPSCYTEIAKNKKDVSICDKIANKVFPVIGAGNHDADLMFIGEAPGKNEAKTYCQLSNRWHINNGDDYGDFDYKYTTRVLEECLIFLEKTLDDLVENNKDLSKKFIIAKIFLEFNLVSTANEIF